MIPLAPLRSARLTPVDWAAMRERLRLTAVSAGIALLAAPAYALFVLSVVSVPLGLVGVGFAVALVVVPLTEQLTRLHRTVCGALLDEVVHPGYAPSEGPLPGRPLVWLRDPARWRDVGHLAFSMTGGLVLSALPAFLLLTWVAHLVGLVLDTGWVWAALLAVSLPGPLVWWFVTPHLVRARALADRGIFGHARVERLERRVTQVESSRSQLLDSSAAEVRRIERDLHDGAQARIVAAGMSVGLAEKLLRADPDLAESLLREARESTVSALEELRSVVRGIHPPALADRGLAGAVEALAVSIPLPITLQLDVPALDAPVESAAYFAVAECLTNAAKHSGASHAWVRASRSGDRLVLVVGDDGSGGAEASGSGLSGVARRLAAFDGTMSVESPAGGPTTITMEVPCASSSPRT